MSVRPAGQLVVPVVAALVALSACGSSHPSAPGTPANPGGSETARVAASCQEYSRNAASARSPIDAMRKQAVLPAFIDLIEMGPREVANRASTLSEPSVAAAMRELVSSIDDLDAQSQSRLPPGGNPAATTVRLDPNRLAAALDGVDRACAPYGHQPVSSAGSGR
jgi:hypothetical protein